MARFCYTYILLSDVTRKHVIICFFNLNLLEYNWGNFKGYKNVEKRYKS